MLLLDDLGAIAQLEERVTVNHDVTGSSPVGGVIALLQNQVINRENQVINRGLTVSLKKKRTR